MLQARQLYVEGARCETRVQGDRFCWRQDFNWGNCVRCGYLTAAAGCPKGQHAKHAKRNIDGTKVPSSRPPWFSICEKGETTQPIRSPQSIRMYGYVWGHLGGIECSVRDGAEAYSACPDCPSLCHCN